jgi:hypothetical protein
LRPGEPAAINGRWGVDEWMNGNAFVAWSEHPEPWTIERELLRKLSCPLNIDDNAHRIIRCYGRRGGRQFNGLEICPSPTNTIKHDGQTSQRMTRMNARLLILAIVIGGVLALVISRVAYKLPLSLNLRHDLARMSDAQLVERLEQTWTAYSQVEADAWPFKLWASFRGPVRHPSAYAFLSWLAVSSGLSWQFGPSFAFGVRSLLSKRSRALIRMHLAICEVRDINDEMKRRVSARAGQKRT